MSGKSQVSGSSFGSTVPKVMVINKAKMSGKKPSMTKGRKGRGTSDGVRPNEVNAPGFLVDFPQFCTEFGATMMPDLMIKETGGKLLPARPSVERRSHEAEERKSRKTRTLSSPGHASLTSQALAADTPGATSASAAGALGSRRSSTHGDGEDAEPAIPEMNYVIVAFEDEKKREIIKSITFKGFPLQEAHIKALAKCLPVYTTIDTIKFEQSHLVGKQLKQLSQDFQYAENLTEVDIYENSGPEEGYHLILRNCKQLQYLMLRSCRIDDKGAKLLAEELSYQDESMIVPLLYLNLSTNMIEDEGAAALANALRTNRMLTCLTLSGNFIGDDGALALADALTKFQLSDEEVALRRLAVRNRIFKYQQLVEESKRKSTESIQLRRSMKASTASEGGKSRTSASIRPQVNGTREIWKQVDNEVSFLSHPLVKEVWPEGGKLWCAGNLNLNHLNLSFNRINTLGAQRFLQVLCYQMTFKSSLGQSAPPGLVNLVLHGNPIPANWPEWPQMHEMLSQLSGKSITQRYADLEKSRASTDSPAKPKDPKTQ